MSIKCAEVYFANSGNFTFSCIMCNEVFLKALTLAEHLIENHFFSIYPDALKNPFLVAENDLETIRDLFDRKKEIALEDLSSDITNEVIQNIELELDKLQSLDETFEISDSPLIKSNTNEETKKSDNASFEGRIQIPDKNSKNLVTLPALKSITKKPYLLSKHKLSKSLFWKCHVCSKIVRRESRCRHLDMHLIKKYMYCCKFCNEKFASFSVLQQHTRTHTGEPERPFECSECDNKYKVSSHLKEHIKRSHLKIRNYKCHFCDKAFFSNEEAKRHEISRHSQPKPCICEICGLSFTTTQQFRNHQRRHDEPKFQCNQCGKKFHVKRSLTIHEICHKDIKPYQCKVCFTRFPRLKSYSRHMVLHSGIKDYICKLCGKAFAQASGIGCHMKSHGIKYNACNVLRKSQIDEDNK